MYPFSQEVTPVLRSHLEAQTSFLNDMTKSLFESYKQLCGLNVQLAQTMLEESALTSQQLLTARKPTDAISAATSRAQPATEKLRAYQQHLSRLAADSQVELARVAGEHTQQTTETAQALANEVKRVASEESDRSIKFQQEAIRQFTDPFNVKGAEKGRADEAGARH